MPGGIFVLHDDGKLIELKPQEYDSEALLQELIAHYPNLLAGNITTGGEPARFLLIAREAPIPKEAGGAGWWAVDHLFLDQDAIPTFVEVKRSSNTQIRREIVGQMLDYAANAVLYWPPEKIRALFETRCHEQSVGPEDVLRDELGIDDTAEGFWNKVKTNLQAGKVRLLFVADAIPPELERIVEFLNGQMDPAEVLAVEVKQFLGKGLKTLAPRLVGQTVEARDRKEGPQGEQWTEDRFFEVLESRKGVAQVEAARKILNWASQHTSRVKWGRGFDNGSFSPMLDHGNRKYPVFTVYTYGTVEILFQYHQNKPPFDAEEKRLELLQRLNSLPGVSIPKSAITTRPSIPLSALVQETALTHFLKTYEWFMGEVTGHPA